AKRDGAAASAIIAACILVPQLVVAAFSPWVGRAAERRGRRPLLLLGVAALPLRALLLATLPPAGLLIPLQVLDGIGAATFGVLVPLIAADIAGGTGRFSLCMGAIGLAVGIGASASTMLAGWAADRWGEPPAFLALAAAGAGAFLLVRLAMPETRIPAGRRPIAGG
ncbi:MAG: MFS transporter, partial [Acidisphaera sp.]|nr:MFS transporter [Acidisphaera sp.]